MIDRRVYSWMAISAAVWACGAGCVHSSSVPKPPTTHASAALQPTADDRVRQLQAQSAQFATLVKQLPRPTREQNLPVIRQAFTDLTRLLPLVAVGPRGGVFDHQLSVVSDTTTLLSGGSTELSAAPVVDRGLRAVYNALDDAQHTGSLYYEDPALRQTLDRLNSKIQDLDNAQGAMHDEAWSDAFSQVSDAVSRMSTILDQRLNDTATSGPATTQALPPVP